jgi:AcrR family transcriptional regulator
VPQQQRARATVEALLEATALVLANEGCEAASTNRIARVAGVSIASLYQYFPSKEALVAALIDRHLERVSNQLAANTVTALAAPLGEAIRIMVLAHVGLHRARPQLAKALIAQIRRVERFAPITAFRQRIIELTRAWLEGRGAELRVKDLGIAAFTIVHVIDALTQAAIEERPEYLTGDLFVDEVSALLVRYLTGCSSDTNVSP